MGPQPSLEATEWFSGSRKQKPSLGSFAEAFTSILKPKSHNIEYLPVELKFVVFIIALTSLVMFGDAFFWNVLELSGTLQFCF